MLPLPRPSRRPTGVRAVGALLAALLALALAGFAVAGCGGDGEEQGEEGVTIPGSPPPDDRGDFKLTLEPPEDEADEDAASFVEEAGTLEGVVDAMNETIALPRDITVVAQSGEEGPAYDPSSRALVINYPFVNYVAEVFSGANPDISEDDLLTKTDDVVGFVLLHEMGHALVDQLKIPITAKEEDSVDNLAALITTEFIPEGADIALDFADFFALTQKDPSLLEEVDFWDEHSLDIQRANQTVCLVFGSDPDKYGGLAEFIAEERAPRCPQEWEQVAGSWLRLLEPYAKE